MSLYKKDYSRLYPMQDKFLSWWAGLELPFYLTGGTAAGRFYLNHRYSEDLDFFVNSSADFSKNILFIKNQMQKHFTTDISKTIVSEDFARFFIEEDELFLKIEFVNDVAYRAGFPMKTKLGYIDNLTNILSNKLSAITGRDEPKDIFDIVTISANYSFNWQNIFMHTKEKAMINEIDVEDRLYTFPVSSLTSADWFINTPDMVTFEKQLRQIADDFMLGGENSLGTNKQSIDDAMIVQV